VLNEVQEEVTLVKLVSMLLGDRIEQITTATGIKTVVEKVAKAANKDCGCSKRKQTLNNPDLLINKILK
jgi:hypothetical protein